MTFSPELFKNSYICLDFLMFDRFEVWFLEKKVRNVCCCQKHTVGSVLPILLLCSNFGIFGVRSKTNE